MSGIAAPGEAHRVASESAATPAAGRRTSVAASLVLAAWLGAVIFFSASVAPAAFRALGSRAAAGALVGAVLPPLFIAGLAAGLLGVVAAAAAPRSTGGRPVRLMASLGVVVACAAGQFVIAPRIESVRARIGGSLESLPPGAPLRTRFGALHGLSVGALGIAVAAAAAAVGAGIARDGARPVDSAGEGDSA